MEVHGCGTSRPGCGAIGDGIPQLGIGHCRNFVLGGQTMDWNITTPFLTSHAVKPADQLGSAKVGGLSP